MRGPEGEAGDDEKKDKRKQGQRQAASLRAGQRLHPNRKGYGCAAGNCKEWPDGQVERAGKTQAVAAAYLPAQREQAVAAGKADGGYAQQRKAHTCDQEPPDGRPYGASRLMAHVGGEDQVARPKKHAKEHHGDPERFPARQFVSHSHGPSLQGLDLLYPV